MTTPDPRPDPRLDPRLDPWLDPWTVLPHGPVEEIDDGILTVTGALPMPFGPLPRRMTVARLRDGTTAIFSAIALDAPGMARIEAMGRPAILIVPNPHHRKDAAAWKGRYPEIRVLAPPGAHAATRQVVPVDGAADDLDDPETRFRVVPGTGAREAALEIRRAGRLTLVVNDLIGHVGRAPALTTRIAIHLLGLGASAPQIPRSARLLLIRDRHAVAGQFRAWADAPDLRRILVSHGAAIEDDPGQTLRRLATSLGG